MSNKRIKIDPEEIRKRVEAAKAKLALQNQEKQLHPSLLEDSQESTALKLSAPVISQHSTSMANLRLAQQHRQKEQKAKPNPYLSTVNKVVQPPKMLKFLPPGKVSQEAERQREELYAQQASHIAEHDPLKHDSLINEETFDKTEVPEIEWWDAQLFTGSQINQELINDLIQHPVILRHDQVTQLEIKQLHFTRKEIRKTRRIRRAEAQRQRQEQINLGLLPPDVPKLKLSNMMRVNGVAELTAQEPTAVEREVLKQVAEREQKHIQQNEDRKLSPDERQLKSIRKYAENLTSGVNVQVYKCYNLTKQHFYKIQTNATQNHLSGCCIDVSKAAVIIVEGGSKGIRRYKHLLEDRVQWSDDQSCQLLWEGQVGHLSFRSFRTVKCETEAEVQKILGDNMHYWQLARYA